MVSEYTVPLQNDEIVAGDREILEPILEALYKKASRQEEEHSPKKQEPEDPGEVYIWKRPDRRTAKEKEKAAFLDKLKHGQPKTWARPLVWLLRRLMGLNRLVWEGLASCGIGLLLGLGFYFGMIWIYSNV